MNKKLATMIGTAVIGLGSISMPMLTTAQGAGGYNGGNGFGNQAGTQLGLAGADQGGQGSTTFIDVVQSGVNWILGLLGLITVIILIWGGFQMVTAAGNDEKYKKGFTIVKQAVIGLILIGVSWLIVSLIFSFVNSNTTTAGAATGG